MPVPDPPIIAGPGSIVAEVGQAVGPALTAAPAAVAGGAADVLGGALGVDVSAAREWMADRHNWLRVAWFGAGTVLFVVGAAMVAARPAASAAGAAGVVRKVVR